jgi:hypothetical protein
MLDAWEASFCGCGRQSSSEKEAMMREDIISADDDG